MFSETRNSTFSEPYMNSAKVNVGIKEVTLKETVNTA